MIVFQGLEGYDDVRPGTTRVAEYRDGNVEDYAIETEAYGMAVDADDLLARLRAFEATDERPDHERRGTTP